MKTPDAAKYLIREVSNAIIADKMERIRKNMYFFKWFSRTENECGVCGVSQKLAGTILMSPGFDWDYEWLCERCLLNLVGENEKENSI